MTRFRSTSSRLAIATRCVPFSPVELGLSGEKIAVEEIFCEIGSECYPAKHITCISPNLFFLRLPRCDSFWDRISYEKSCIHFPPTIHSYVTKHPQNLPPFSINLQLQIFQVKIGQLFADKLKFYSSWSTTPQIQFLSFLSFHDTPTLINMALTTVKHSLQFVFRIEQIFQKVGTEYHLMNIPRVPAPSEKFRLKRGVRPSKNLVLGFIPDFSCKILTFIPNQYETLQNINSTWWKLTENLYFEYQ